MLSKGLLPLKRVVLFLAMSLPVQCMSFLWSWSSIWSASSPVHQNKYLCCFHEMAELPWLQAGTGCSSGRSCGSKERWAVTADVWVRRYRASSCVRHYTFETKISWSGAKNGADGRSFPPPKTSARWCLLRWGRVQLCWWLCRALGAAPAAALSSGPCPPQGRVCAGDTRPSGRNCLYLCLSRSLFNAWFWLVGFLISLSLLFCWNRHFHTCLRLDPLCAQTAHVWQMSSETNLCWS